MLLLAVAACGDQSDQSGQGNQSDQSNQSSENSQDGQGGQTGATASRSPSQLPSAPPPAPSSVPPGPPQSRPTQGVPPGDTAPAAGQVDASALPAGYPHDVVLADGGSTVVVQAEEAGCDQVSAAAGEQNGDHVVVTVTLVRAPHGKMCPMHVRETPLPVRLAEPLGARKLLLRAGP
ncbi:hypothetical protein GCM10022222_12650 [Amycolatopsis ultiminotia]|uniref:Uncharacterized protein n=1 Tax=Amycolatopsis ultiminotia TaxID=543629 RepID=A0ABP6V9K8_9PSEU